MVTFGRLKQKNVTLREIEKKAWGSTETQDNECSFHREPPVTYSSGRTRANEEDSILGTKICSECRDMEDC